MCRERVEWAEESSGPWRFVFVKPPELPLCRELFMHGVTFPPFQIDWKSQRSITIPIEPITGFAGPAQPILGKVEIIRQLEP